MKQCTKCKETKELSEFNAYKRNKTDGKRAQCKTCTKAAGKKRYYENGGREKDKQNYFKNRDKRIAQMKEHRENNKEYFTEYGKAYREQHKEHLRIKATERTRERYQNDIPCCFQRW